MFQADVVVVQCRRGEGGGISARGVGWSECSNIRYCEQRLETGHSEHSEQRLMVSLCEGEAGGGGAGQGLRVGLGEIVHCSVLGELLASLAELRIVLRKQRK